MKIVPDFGIKQVVNPAMTGTQAPKPALNNAQALINIPAPEPVTPAARAPLATENTKAANVLPDIFGVEVGA